MRNSRYIVLGLAAFAALTLAAQRADADNNLCPVGEVVALAPDGLPGDGRPPSPGPTAPDTLTR